MPPSQDSAPRSGQERHFQTDHLQDNLIQHSVRGTAVTAIGQAVKIVAQFASIIILARLLTPEAFGLIAMVAVVLSFLEMFKDLGLTAATVQRKNISHAEVSTLFWLNAALGLAAAVVIASLAPVLAWFFEEPALVDITVALGVAVAVGGIGTQHLALLRRQMRFSALMFLQIGAEVIAMTFAVWLAIAGADYWALVIQRIVWAILLSLGGWILCDWRPAPPWRVTDIRPLLAFGGNVTGAGLAGFATRHLDQILIGWYWGPAALGFYERAYKLLLVPVNNINAPLFTVLMPALSRLADQPERYRRTYMAAVSKVTMITMPCAAVVIVIPDWIVAVLFGPHWAEAAPILGWFGLAMLYQPLTYTGSWLFMSQNRTHEMLWCGLANAGLSIVAVVAALPYGPTGVAAVWCVTGLFTRVPLLFWIIGRKGPVHWLDFLQCLTPGSHATIAICILLTLLRVDDGFDGLTPSYGLGMSVAIAVTVSLLCYVSTGQGRDAIRSLGRVYRILFSRRMRV